MKICKICGKTFGSIYTHEKLCLKIKNFCESNCLSKQDIEKEYLDLGSVLAFADKYCISTGFAYNLFKFHNIDCSIKRSSNNRQVKEKRAKTSLEKYGVEHNFCKDHPSRKNWENRLLEEEGIINVFQRESVKEKCINTIVKKYGSKQNLGKRFQKGSAISSLNKLIYTFLDENNIDYDSEFPIKNPEINRYLYIYDIRIDNLLIEINGDYWHGNPKIYKPDDIILKGSSGEILVKNKWDSDKKKIDFAKTLGYTVLVVWEYDLINNFEEIKEIIYARVKDQKNNKNS